MASRFKNFISATLAVIWTLSPLGSARAYVLLSGAGATFPYPIYSKWFDFYHKINPDVRINYQSIGSGGGIRQFMDKTIDFGATDNPMTDSEISRIGEPIHQIPTVLGGVVPAFNLKGIETLNFSGDVLAAIYLGEIKNWNDSAIQKLNPGVDLPREPITVVHRADGSGTTYCFTDYLSNVSPTWKRKVGTGQSVNWPLGLGAKGNEGVAGIIRQSRNSIGYLELIYAKQLGMSFGAVKNQAGNFVKADIESVSAAAASVKMPEDFRVSIVNAPGEKSYPISTYTWLLIKEHNKGQTGPILKGFLDWMLSEGQTLAPTLYYASLPDDVKAMVKKTVSKIQ